jgi:xanthine dehydrogenase accessory factor
MKPLIREMADLFSKGEAFVLATVVSRNGSAPRSAGARMLVRRDGSTLGTVGGGILEAQVEKLASNVHKNHKGVLQGFTFTGKDAATMDSICGGEVEVLVEWLDPGHAVHAAIVQGLHEAITERTPVWLITMLTEEKIGISALVTAQGGVVGNLPPGLDVSAASQALGHTEGLSLMIGASHLPEKPGIILVGDERVLIEKLDSGKTALIFGAGHVSKALAEFTHAVGFRTVVLDDRAEYANDERFPEADQLIVLDSFNDALGSLVIDYDSFVVIVTRGHVNDLEILAQCLKTDAGYIGMIGSRRKCALIFEQLRNDGFGDADIQRVHAPIGLAIAAETPEEIGISIVAEMIKVRAELDKT